MSDAVSSVNGSTVLRNLEYLPEPRNRLGAMLGGGFKNALSTALGIATQAVGVGGAGLTSENAILIQEQMRQQEQMQQVSMISNIERSKHEMAMTPIRNIRIG
jgi:hypothetical protein